MKLPTWFATTIFHEGAPLRVRSCLLPDNWRVSTEAPDTGSMRLCGGLKIELLRMDVMWHIVKLCL
jgi:hypothetical protein